MGRRRGEEGGGGGGGGEGGEGGEGEEGRRKWRGTKQQEDIQCERDRSHAGKRKMIKTKQKFQFHHLRWFRY